jgi:hypothetical protein
MILLILRSLGAVFAGLVTVIVLVALGQTLGHWLFPVPPDTLTSNMESDGGVMQAGTMPLGALVTVPVAWLVAALGGSWVAARLAGRAPLAHGLAVGAFMLAMALFLFLMFSHPGWIWVAALVGIPVASSLGASLARPRGPKPLNSPDPV